MRYKFEPCVGQKLEAEEFSGQLNDLATVSVGFPFERDRTCTFGELRTFERALSAARQADQLLSKEWRVPATGPMKRAVKVREETYPLMLLADAKGYPEDATFKLTPLGLPKIDAFVEAQDDRFALQITIADLIWICSDGSLSNGGYDERLVREALNEFGVVHGLAAMRRRGESIVSEKPVKSSNEVYEACVRGIENALRRKIDCSSREARLLVDARGYRMNAIDFGFARVIEGAFDMVGRARLDMAFSRYYFVDEGAGMFFEYIPLD